MPITSLIFSVGGVLFDGFEVPQTLTDIGGKQAYAEHDFPGGFRTQQLYGAFPEPISWKGMFTGTDALARMREVDRLRVAGQEVPLIFGNTIMLGIVTEFRGMPRHQWLVDYVIKFCPRLDLSSSTVLDEILSVFHTIMDAINQLSAILEVALAPGSSGPTIAATNIAITQAYAPLPPQLIQPAQDYIALVLSGMQSALGIPQDIAPNDAAAIIASAAAFEAVAAPLTTSSDPTVASPALDALGYVEIATLGVQNPSSKPITSLSVINPNLMSLAAQYYGDASKWQVISDASGLSPDPLPIGGFTLTIPPTA